MNKSGVGTQTFMNFMFIIINVFVFAPVTRFVSVYYKLSKGDDAMVVFNSYNHFKNYCLKIVSNKGIEITKSPHQAFDNFEAFIEFLR